MAMTHFIDIFRNNTLARKMAEHLRSLAPEPATFMEVCGTHTMAIARSGIRQMLPPGIRLVSGPGCPVCVTSAADIDTFIAAAGLKNSIITTFGDLIRVPGSSSSLQKEMARGADVRVVYSPLDALEIAGRNPDQEVIFLGVGFETTAPTIGGAILTAEQEQLPNFTVISSHKVIPPALEALASDPAIQLGGLICPGHVSVIIGADAYQPLADRHHIPCVVAGFEPIDILQAVIMLINQQTTGAKVEIAYQRAVTRKGNPRALEVMNTVFAPATVEWRGLGAIPDSGLQIRPRFERFDAKKRFDLQVEIVHKPTGCRCGEVLKGIIAPPDCRLFGAACLPAHPIGPCMVSSEGACAAFYRYDASQLV